MVFTLVTHPGDEKIRRNLASSANLLALNFNGYVNIWPHVCVSIIQDQVAEGKHQRIQILVTKGGWDESIRLFCVFCVK